MMETPGQREIVMSNNPALIEQFISYLRAERHFSAHTARCYAADLDQFRGFLLSPKGELPAKPERNGTNGSTHAHGPHDAASNAEVDKRLLAVDSDKVRQFMSQLRDKNYCKSTVARKLATLRSFYKFVVRRGTLASNPVATI